MNKVLVTVVSILVSIAAASSVSAQERVDARRGAQQVRIADGVGEGQLNRRETRRLERGQMRVERRQQVARADGVVTVREQRRLERMQNRQSRRIFRARHNAR